MPPRALLAGGLTALAFLLSSVVPGPSRALDAEPSLHLQLDRSAPGADATVASPSEIRLWFSQVPQAGATSARLIHDGGPVEAMGELKADPDDATVFAAPVAGALTPGLYTVSWRAMAADGHVVRGDFDFTVEGR